MSAPERPTTIEGGFVPIVAAAHIAPCTYRYVVAWDGPGGFRHYVATPPLWRESLPVDHPVWLRFVARLEADMVSHPPALPPA